MIDYILVESVSKNHHTNYYHCMGISKIYPLQGDSDLLSVNPNVAAMTTWKANTSILTADDTRIQKLPRIKQLTNNWMLPPKPTRTGDSNVPINSIIRRLKC